MGEDIRFVSNIQAAGVRSSPGASCLGHPPSPIPTSTMSPAQGKEGKRNLRPKPGKGSNVSKQKELPLEVKDDKKDERKFVPWLGEARPKRGPIYDVESKVGTKLNVVFMNGRVIEGILDSCDRTMNMVFVNTVELLDDNQTRELGKVFVCGRVESMGPA